MQSLTPTPRAHFGPLTGGGSGGGGAKKPTGPSVSWPADKFCSTPSRYLVPGLSFQGRTFNEQQTTFV